MLIGSDLRPNRYTLPVGLEHHHEGLVDLVTLCACSFRGAFGETLGEVRPLHRSLQCLPSTALTG